MIRWYWSSRRGQRLEAQLVELITLVRQGKKEIMAELDNLKGSAATLITADQNAATELAAWKTSGTALKGQITDLSAQVASLQAQIAAGGTIAPGDLQAVADSLSAAATTLQAAEDANAPDAAPLAPAA